MGAKCFEIGCHGKNFMHDIICFSIIVSMEEARIYLKVPQSGLGSMQGSSSTESHLPQEVIFHRRLSSTIGRLPPKVNFHQRSSSTKSRLSPKVVFHQWSSSIYHNTLVDLIFVRTVNIPNLNLLPCFEVAYFF